MKMLVVVVFIISFASIFYAPSASTETSSMLSLPSLQRSHDYDPIQEIKTCGYKYGLPAAKRQFPHVAFLKSKRDFQVKYCSGSLIHPRWVLTSAYCTFPDAKVKVTLGALVPFDEEDPDRVVVYSEFVYIHPEYLPLYKRPKNDVALIKLSRSVRSASIMPVYLKRGSIPITKDNITFAAWGQVGYETMAFTKQMMIFKGPCHCRETQGTSHYEDAAWDSEFFCCVSVDYFCFIHTGGGLIINGALVGIMTERCFSHCRHHEGMVTNLYKHQQWIDDTLTADCAPSSRVYEACSGISGTLSGVYLIQPNDNVKPFEVFCELSGDGEKWTVIQQRFNESVDFYRNYTNYTDGFGSLTGNYWLGLEKIHQLTKNDEHELYVEVRSYNLTKAYALYSSFKVDSAQTGYKLFISGYTGYAGDSMTFYNLNGIKFSTYDNDQDEALHNCAVDHHGAWWYKACAYR